MNDEAESSLDGQRYAHANADLDDISVELDATDATDAELDEAEEMRQREQLVKERRMDAKRKRIVFLDHVLRELDTVVFLELIAVYCLDCSFFWFACKMLVHASLLTPLPDLALARQHDERKPWLPLILCSFLVPFVLHLSYPAPAAGEDTRGYLHGGLMIDFVGQEGPTAKWKLAGLDTTLLVLQVVMVSAHVKRRDLKKKLAAMTGGAAAGAATAVPSSADANTSSAPPTAGREQDADSEERGVLRRTDSLSDAGPEPDEDDALLPSPAETGHADALDLLTSGQCVIGNFALVDTLLQEHQYYQQYRQNRTEAGASSSLSPSTLRQLQSIRVRFGVGGG